MDLSKAHLSSSGIERSFYFSFHAFRISSVSQLQSRLACLGLLHLTFLLYV